MLQSFSKANFSYCKEVAGQYWDRGVMNGRQIDLFLKEQ